MAIEWRCPVCGGVCSQSIDERGLPVRQMVCPFCQEKADREYKSMREFYRRGQGAMDADT